MINNAMFSVSSLRNRMLLIFLLLLSIIVIVTLYTVQNATYKHSTGQLQAHNRTSASVVKNLFENRARQLSDALETLSKDFSMKQLISGAKDDPESLRSALMNHQRRVSSDITWALGARGELLTSSTNENINGLEVKGDSFKNGNIRWLKLNEEFYLVKSAPVKFVESSRNINAWLFMGVLANSLVNQELVDLTDMHISLFVPGEDVQLLGSTLSENKQQQLMRQQMSLDKGLHNMGIAGEEHIYTTSRMGLWNDTPLYLLLSTVADKAYLSYNSLIGQLIGLLLIAAIMALVAAMFMSKGITGPITALVKVTKKIHQGIYVEKFPASTTYEISTLSTAVSDMQQGIKQREEENHRLAFFDELTGLPNRTSFTTYIQDAINSPKDTKFAVLMMDLDRFKDVNDTVGHELGDKLLQEIAQRLKALAIKNAFCARIGGDEYGIVVSNYGEISPEALADNFASVFERPFMIEQLTLDIDASIGVALYPNDGDTTQELIQCADIALYSCKGQHFTYTLYQPELNNYSVQRLNLMSELRGALSEGQLQLFYQPKLLIQENRISTVECLIRWIHPTHGFINPDEFIPLAEQTGVIRDVTGWALRVALQQQKKWADAGLDIGVAVNISAIDLIDMKLPIYVSELMGEFNTEPNMLTIEVTESAIMCDPEAAMKALNTLRRMGIVLSIDDFGTGYSSMEQLKIMPVDELKIDKAFVLDVANNQQDQIMVKTMVSLAQNLSLSTVAEGVEDAKALAFLAQIGCTKAQGYYMSKALPIEEFDVWHQQFIEKQQDQSIA